MRHTNTLGLKIMMLMIVLLVVVSSVSAITENTGQTFNLNAEGQTARTGEKVFIASPLTITNIQKYSATDTIFAYILDASKNVLVQSTFSGNNANFSYLLSGNTYYYFAVDSNGGAYTNYYNSATYNISTGYILYTAGLGTTGADLNNFFLNINSITFTITPKSITPTLIYPSGTILANSPINFIASYTSLGYSIDNATYYIFNPSGTLYNSTFTTINNLLNQTTQSFNLPSGNYNWDVGVCGRNATGYLCSYATNNSITASQYQDNGMTYTSPILEGQTNQIIGNFSFATNPTSITLNYNGTNSTPSFSTSGNNYLITSNVIAPYFLLNQNISFYYLFNIGGTQYTSTPRNQSVNAISVSTTCGGGTFTFLNITNYDEETLSQISGTVEYSLNLTNGNNQIATLSGNATGTNIILCSSSNLSTYSSSYSLLLRYYGNGYVSKTYNVQNNPGALAPISIPLYYLSNSTGTKFNINYLDFYYLTHPNAIIQIQRQYLSTNTYNTVEIPTIGSDGISYGSFNTNNIRYKLIVIDKGVILDTFNDIFPVCQNIVLGECALNLRGLQSTQTTTSGDFTYTLTNLNNQLTLTFVIPSGTPQTVTFSTNQSSRFLPSVSSCTSSVFSSGGTLTCAYNNTIGDSTVGIEIDNSAGTIYGSLHVSENLNSFFMSNNYFIAFILLLVLALIFVSSGTWMVISGGIGLLFLGLIFLINGANFILVSTSLIWLIIAIIIVVYKISQREEKYL